MHYNNIIYFIFIIFIIIILFLLLLLFYYYYYFYYCCCCACVFTTLVNGSRFNGRVSGAKSIQRHFKSLPKRYWSFRSAIFLYIYVVPIEQFKLFMESNLEYFLMFHSSTSSAPPPTPSGNNNDTNVIIAVQDIQ